MRSRSASLVSSLVALSALAAACAVRPKAVATPRAPSANVPPHVTAAPLHAEVAPPAEPPLVQTPEPAASKPPCKPEMAYVKGEYCTEVQQDCTDWMEPPTKDGVGRCRRFAPSVCKGKRVPMEFCIDRDEYTAEGQTLPMGTTSWTEAKTTCEQSGKRLCLESEWNFACEGEEMFPYPIGLERDSTKCNYDQLKLLDAWGKPIDHRRSSASLQQCTSPFGVRNMSGNVDEWTFRDVMNGSYRAALKGGWWMAARNRCRPATTAHNEVYRDFQTGFRCCGDVATEQSIPSK